MAAIDTLHEITAEASALQILASNLDADSLFEDFGWGLGLLLTHICNDLAKLEKEMLKEAETP